MRNAFFPAMTPLRRAVVWATLSLSVATGAQALTLARPQVLSGVDEPLRAEIDFVEISSDEQQGLQAGLASASTYAAMRLEAPPVPLQVELLQRANGRPFVRLSSSQALPQKTLDVLLQLRWASGQLLRDLSIALDATATAKAPAPPLQAPAEAGSASPDTERARVSVKPGDTASALVSPLRPANVSLDQMLLALLRQNPDAFVENNVHRLKAGSLLQVPSAEQALSAPADEAREEMLLQTEDFNRYRAELAGWAGRGDLAEAERQSSGSVRGRVQTTTPGTKDQLTLTRPQDAGAQEQLARQKQARDIAQRAAELGRNVSELERLASEAASSTGDGPNLPKPSDGASWLDTWSQSPLTPVAAGSLIALLVLAGLWRQRRQTESTGLPPLKVDFDLDLPDLPDLPPSSAPASTATAAPTSAPTPARASTATARPMLGIPDISLDLNADSPHPMSVRLALAQQLWDLGQHHTSRALAEEIIAEGQGEWPERARQWLAQRG